MPARPVCPRLALKALGPSASETISVTSNMTAPTSAARSTSKALVLLKPPILMKDDGCVLASSVSAAAKAPLLQDDVASAAAPKLRHRQNYHLSNALACVFGKTTRSRAAAARSSGSGSNLRGRSKPDGADSVTEV